MEAAQAQVNKYLKLLSKRRFTFAICSACIMSAIILVGYFLPRKYEAKSSVLIESNMLETLVKGIAVTTSMEERIKVLKDTMLGREIISKVLQKLGPGSPPKKGDDPEKTIFSFMERTKVSVKGHDLFTVSFQDQNPKLAMDYVNTLVKTYVEENILAKREESSDANKFLAEQVALFREKINRAEEAIVKYRQEQGVYVSIDERSVIEEIKTQEQTIEQVETEKNELMAVRESLKKQLAGEKPLMLTMYSSTPGNKRENAIAALENKLAQLLLSYTENYPEVIKTRAEIEALKRQASAGPSGKAAESEPGESQISAVNPFFQQLKLKLSDTEAKINALNSKKVRLQALIKKREQELRYMPEGKKKLADLEKERDSYKTIYEQLQTRLGQSEVSTNLEMEDKAARFKTVDPATLPTTPVSPNRVAMILVSIFLGLFGGLAGVYILETLDSSIKSVEALRDLKVELFGVIPDIYNEEEQKKKAQKDRFLYKAAGIYVLVIGFLLLNEILGLGYIDFIIAHIIRPL